MKGHREDIFWVVPDLPFDILVPHIQHDEDASRILSITRPDQDKDEQDPKKLFCTVSQEAER